jgi:hypothetical protein
MKNSECTIYIISKDRWIQKFKKGKDGWTLTTSKNAVYPCTPEQVLSHLLPSLAGIKGQQVTVKVVPDNGITRASRSESNSRGTL